MLIILNVISDLSVSFLKKINVLQIYKVYGGLYTLAFAAW